MCGCGSLQEAGVGLGGPPRGFSAEEQPGSGVVQTQNRTFACTDASALAWREDPALPPRKPRSMVSKSGHETQCHPRFEKSSESTSAQEHVDRAENRTIGNFMRTCVHQLDRRTSSWVNRSRRLQPGRQSKYWAHEHRQRRERSFGKLARASWCVAERVCRLRSKEAWSVTPIAGHKNMVKKIAVKFGREILRNIVRDY